MDVDNDAEIAEPCADEAIAQEMRALLKDERSNKNVEDADLLPVAMSISTAVSYITSMK